METLNEAFVLLYIQCFLFYPIENLTNETTLKVVIVISIVYNIKIYR